LSDVTIDQEKVDRLVQLWKQKVAPHDQALKEAAQAQYDTISALRREQQRLIDEADRVQRTIDELEKKYQDMTTPRPEPVGP
jgi:chromosome segregation ATPase